MVGRVDADVAGIDARQQFDAKACPGFVEFGSGRGKHGLRDSTLSSLPQTPRVAFLAFED